MNDLHLPVRTRVTAWIKVLKWPGSTASLSVFGGALWVACVSSAHASLFRHLTATDAPSITKNASNVVTAWDDHYCPSFLADPTRQHCGIIKHPTGSILDTGYGIDGSGAEWHQLRGHQHEFSREALLPAAMVDTSLSQGDIASFR